MLDNKRERNTAHFTRTFLFKKIFFTIILAASSHGLTEEEVGGWEIATTTFVLFITNELEYHATSLCS